MLSKIQEAVKYIQSRHSKAPIAGIVLGSGLGSFVSEMKVEAEILYTDIPHFPVSTVEGHSGKLIFGTLSGREVVAMAGRFHYYEGYRPTDVVFPIRVMKFLGVQSIFISNAAGATNTSYKVGDLMMISDHVSFFTPNPLVGKNINELGTRFPDMSEPYNSLLREKAKKIAEAAGIHIHEGVYFSVTGPTFETHAEYRMLNILGADAVGMSTVQETIAAVHMGLTVFGMSVITDIGIRDDKNTITHAEVLEAAKHAEPKLTHIFKELVGQL
ncbi:MAG: purine-nucleoside phosphorylase [Ferruginibacter sp.]|nr:purine-nucleoside phosphorylase [Ferruginibacter sp.]